MFKNLVDGPVTQRVFSVFYMIKDLWIKDYTRLEDVMPRIKHERLALFGHMARVTGLHAT